MDRVSLAERIWYETSVPVFLERFLLPLAAALTLWLVFANSMNFDWTQRISGGLALVFFAYFLSHTIHKTKDVKPSAPIPHKTETQATALPREPSTQSAIQASSSQSDRVFLPSDITVAYLVGIAKSNTEMQTRHIISPYLGKWMTVSGAVFDAGKHSGRFLVTIRMGEPSAEAPFVGAWFDPQWDEQISLLRPGSQVKITGRLTGMGYDAPTLEDAEIER
jgi:hypothetical protein